MTLTYRYFNGQPLYPFGFGLSYTNFKYSNLQIAQTGQTITVKVNVTNTGKFKGDEVVQLYLSHKNATYKTPIRALKGYQRINFKVGETKQVTFKLGNNELFEVDDKAKTVATKGDIEFSVGGGQPNTAMLAKGYAIQKKFIIN
jgi:beta-glucosidase